uniref:Protein N-terminal glutamine amidohydrolase n=1 Tax=Entomoneis paludosa TaxID=265537 RepID=A0A7S2YJG8_9STRA|mmetsp:Transcript_35710/g.74312  ORF Transcript_35710/g.74312 Transcript_35710/m.74312 type:complete len:214 (+) Transcript_35710:48-689(+)
MEAGDYSLTAPDTALAAPSDHGLRVPYYCEENVWRLAYRKKHEFPGDRFWVVFISNTIKNVPMFHQKASDDPSKSVSWDYHVILLAAHASQPGVCVYDVDSRLSYPCPLAEYMQQSFPYEWPMPFAPLFRVVEADIYLQCFASDRMHMYNREKGTWNAPPPNYAPIQSGQASSTSNLEHYLNFVERPNFHEVDMNAFGTILTKQQLAAAAFAG